MWLPGPATLYDAGMTEQMITVFGLPAHPLVIHAVVVLLPLAALCAIAVAVRPTWRRRFGWPVLALTVAAALSVPAATETGGQLAETVYGDPLPDSVAAHQQLGEQLLPYATIFGGATFLFIVIGAWVDRRWKGAASDTAGPPMAWQIVMVALAVLVIASAAWTTMHVARVGDSGAQSVWGWVTDE